MTANYGLAAQLTIFARHILAAFAFLNSSRTADRSPIPRLSCSPGGPIAPPIARQRQTIAASDYDRFFARASSGADAGWM
jgi:hypothetical protein